MRMELQQFDLASHDVLAVLPERAHDIARLRALAQRQEQPTVTVIGKYNHGKSRLLNELMGSDIFSIADKRETVVLAEHIQPDVRWLDAPGLDADVDGEDDGHAQEAAWLQADIRLFVHAAKEGELDAAERSLLEKLQSDEQRTQRQTLFVLTQIDQLSDEAELQKVSDAIGKQVPQKAMYPVSSTRHRLGVDAGKKLLLEKSGVPSLREALLVAMAKVPQARLHEKKLLTGEIRNELQQLRISAEQEQQDRQDIQKKQLQDFEQGLAEVLAKVQSDLQPVLSVNGVDHALIPDTAEYEFKLTPGKKERARIQIAYSRACIAIRGHLVKHGVAGPLFEQQTSVRSLDTVMVAVMGVSVKYRDDLRRLFCEAAGRARLSNDFTHYFERSEERLALAQLIASGESNLSTLDSALAALGRMEAA